MSKKELGAEELRALAEHEYHVEHKGDSRKIGAKNQEVATSCQLCGKDCSQVIDGVAVVRGGLLLDKNGYAMNVCADCYKDRTGKVIESA